MNKDTENISKPVNCSLKLIRQAADEKWTKSLALFHLLKASYGNSVIYNYRSRMPEIAEKFNISTKALYNYITRLREKELVFDFKNHLSLKSIRNIKHNLCDKRKTQINNFNTDSLCHIQCRLYEKLIEHHIKKMAFNEALRRYGTRDQHKMELGADGFRPSFSLRNIAKLLNINERTVIKVLNTLVSLGIIDTKKTKVRKISNDKFPVNLLTDFPGYLFVTERGTFQVFGNSIRLIEYPVNLPKITLKIYSKHYKSIKCKKYNNLINGYNIDI